MTDNTSSYKLKNPTAYHLFAQQQQQQQQHVSLSHLQLDSNRPTMDFSEYYRQRQPQFLSPESTSPPIQDFDDLDQQGLPISFSNMMLVPEPSTNYFFPSKINTSFLSPPSTNSTELFQEESPSEYASSVDHPFYHHHQRHNSQDTMATSPPSVLFNQPFSAPAQQTGYEFLTNHMQSITAYHQDKQKSLSHSLVTGANSLEEYESIQISQQLLSEKKRRRRESHNAVERRRRENINERIQELGTLLPEAMLEELVCTSVNGNNNKPNKGAILRKSVDHIRLLQHEVSSYKQRILELENQLTSLTH